MGYGGIKSLQYRHLYNVCLKWSDAELFELINALERDISFSSFELGQLVRTKTSIDVDEFVEALMDVDESELEGRGVVFPEEKPEEPIDILLRSARYCCTERYNSYAAESQVKLRRGLRNDREQWWVTKAKEMEKASMIGNTRQLFSPIRETIRQMISETIPEENGTIISSQDRRLERWKEHYEE
uniref:Uncharacterized protein n=1 Tax=Trichobilharzia regenti TaxID=157069 RepID=A0AA85JH57_TRIRE|nr:unnamed protein product [Trichobilharzia regenti]